MIKFADRQPSTHKLGRAVGAFVSGDGRQIREYTKRMGLGIEIAYPMTRAIRFVREPHQIFRRRAALAGIKRSPTLAGRLDKRTGWGVFRPGEIPGTADFVARLNAIVDTRRGGGYPDGEPFRRTLISPTDLQAHPALLDFLLSDAILQTAADYLGAVPVLQTFQVWQSPPNSTVKGSQNFHRDNIDHRQVKFFVNLNDIGMEQGPFAFLPADVSKRVSSGLGHWRRRIADDEIFAHCSPSDTIYAVGAVGTCHVVDSSRCFHFVARTKSGERLLAMFNFASCYCPMKTVESACDAVRSWYRGGDRLRRLALGLD